ncbi:MAG: cytochrome c biogenesis CcdA family protein [Candidatus Woesearchaeota archaeon]
MSSIMNPSVSFFSGLVAAFTPCVIVLFPIVLYRFFGEDKKDYGKYLLFTSGFMIAFMIFAMALGSAMTSVIQNGFRIGLGFLLVTLGILSIFGRLNPLNFPLMKNTFLLGMVFAVAVALNPCSLPYLAAIISLDSTGQIMFNILSFGIGMLIPSLLFAFLGQSLLDITGKAGKIFSALNKSMSLVLVVAGIYMIYVVSMFNYLDIFVVLVFMLLIFVILLRSFLIIKSKDDLKKPSNIILILAGAVLLIAVLSHCDDRIDSFSDNMAIGATSTPSTDSVADGAHSCSADTTFMDCSICQRCVALFGSALLLFMSGNYIKKRSDVLLPKK